MRRDQRIVGGLAVVVYGLVGMGVYFGLFGCANKAAVKQQSFSYQVPQGMLATPDVLISTETNPPFVMTTGQTFTTPYWSNCPTKPTTENVGEGEQGGARRVRIAYPNMPNGLYGVLAFCRIDPEFKGSASRSYRLEVPQSYVEATDGGRMSVVFEQYAVGQQQFPAWILWMSREPIPVRGGVEPVDHRHVDGPPPSTSLGGTQK